MAVHFFRSERRQILTLFVLPPKKIQDAHWELSTDDCEVLENLAHKQRRHWDLRMLKAGKYALEEIAAISGLSLDEVKKLNADKTA